jgi:hypothetical protein
MASDNDAGYWRARYEVLYSRCLDMLPQIENQFSTDETEDWCKLMWRLEKEAKR